CRTAWTNTNTTYSARAATPAKMSCDVVKAGPGALVVNVGRARASVAIAARVASAAETPSTRNATTWWRSAPTNRQSTTTPLHTIMKAENTVSRARVSTPTLDEVINMRISPTSMTVTATARISVPNGSPTRRATTSAWWTAASTAATRAIATTA